MLPSLENKKVGILGGSFNPAHEGHLFISQAAIVSLNFDFVIWLISPHNPLKKKEDLLDYKKRLFIARQVASKNEKIIVSDYEKVNNLQFTFETLRKISSEHKNTKFCWMMGADCLSQFDNWKNWQEIFNNFPIVIFKRKNFAIKKINNVAGLLFKKHKKSKEIFVKNFGESLPLCHLLNSKLINVSATQIREEKYNKNYTYF